MEVSGMMLFLLCPRDHVADQQVVVLHHGPDGLVGDGCPAVPDPPAALHPEDVPQSSSLHLLWTPPVEIVPGDAVEDLQVLSAQPSLVILSAILKLTNDVNIFSFFWKLKHAFTSVSI